MKRFYIAAFASLGFMHTPAYSNDLPVVDVYETASCPCCKDWDAHMRQNGFEVRTHLVDDPSKFREKFGMSDRYGSCHTARVGNYTIEGHVPANDIKQLLKEKPNAIGLSVPGMVPGSPGMESSRPMPYDSLLVRANGTASPYRKH